MRSPSLASIAAMFPLNMAAMARTRVTRVPDMVAMTGVTRTVHGEASNRPSANPVKIRIRESLFSQQENKDSRMQILKTLLTNLHFRIHICEHWGNLDFYGIGRWSVWQIIHLIEVLKIGIILHFPRASGLLEMVK